MDIISKTDKIINVHGSSADAAIPLLQAIQKEFNYLPAEALKRVSEKTEISLQKLYGISTFYSQFRHKPVGRHIVKVCVGTACHVKGATLVYDAFIRELKITDGEDTDNDMLFTVEKVACLGCCTIAPVVQIDDHTFGHVNPSKVKDIIIDFLKNKSNPIQSISLLHKENKANEGEIRVGLGSCCVASGSLDIKNQLEKSLSEIKVPVNVKQVGCVGICNQIPMLEIHKPGEIPHFYTKISPSEVDYILRKHFKPHGFITWIRSESRSILNRLSIRNMPVSLQSYPSSHRSTPITDFLSKQINIATENRGEIKPNDFDEYIENEGFKAVRNCVFDINPDKVVNIVKNSGLKGRGGGGFLTGLKWEIVKNQKADKKYVICNGDEGDPGAFMDRMLLESYPYRIIEGMLIAGFAIGASKGIFYIRAEYPLAVKRINDAINICKKKNIIGNNIMKSDFSFDIELFEGAGAFICGEETALIASVEGNRGTPRLRPPYPSEMGLWGYPTLINNTETLASISWIIRNSAADYKKIGTKNNSGTKVFALAGKVNRGGLIEVPLGTTIREIVEDIGGGVPDGKKFKAVQIGGPSGGCIPESLADTPIDFDSLKNIGAMMGSGGLVVLNEDDCMVDIAKYFLEFTQDQSCGKCTFCRVGTKRMLEILEKITSGKGRLNDLELLEKIAQSTIAGSICGLGKSASNPVLSTLRYFRDEYIEHINGRCPSGKCKDMITYSITDDCIGCTICAQHCPVDAIEFEPYKVHEINTELCTKCDICRVECPVNAVITI